MEDIQSIGKIKCKSGNKPLWGKDLADPKMITITDVGSI